MKLLAGTAELAPHAFPFSWEMTSVFKEAFLPPSSPWLKSSSRKLLGE